MHCVDLGESFPTSTYLQHLASIQPRTSPFKFAGGARRGEKRFRPAARKSAFMQKLPTFVNMSKFVDQHTFVALPNSRSSRSSWLHGSVAKARKERSRFRQGVRPTELAKLATLATSNNKILMRFFSSTGKLWH